jgi:hypothetical protein
MMPTATMPSIPRSTLKVVLIWGPSASATGQYRTEPASSPKAVYAIQVRFVKFKASGEVSNAMARRHPP